MNDERRKLHVCFRSSFIVLTSSFIFGCAENGPTLESRQARSDDTPFGGGFPANHRPGGDPLDRDSRREEVRVKWPEARVGEPRSAADEKFMQERR